MTARLESFIAAVESGAERMVQRALRGLRYRKPAAGARRRPSGVPEASDSVTDDLPQSYGRSRVVAMAVDPYHVHVYWEVTDGDVLHATEQLRRSGQAKAPWVLRFHDLTGVGADGSALGHFDIPIQLGARSWYVDLWAGNKTYVVELGAGGGSRFVVACRSQPVNVPPAEPAAAPSAVAWQVVGTPVSPDHPAARVAAQSLTEPRVHPSARATANEGFAPPWAATVDAQPPTQPSRTPERLQVPPPPLPRPTPYPQAAADFQWPSTSVAGAVVATKAAPRPAPASASGASGGTSPLADNPSPPTLRSTPLRSKSVSLGDPARSSGGAFAVPTSSTQAVRRGSRE